MASNTLTFPLMAIPMQGPSGGMHTSTGSTGGSEYGSHHSSDDTRVSSLTSASARRGRLYINSSKYDVVVPNDLIPLHDKRKDEIATKYQDHGFIDPICPFASASSNSRDKHNVIVLTLTGIKKRCHELAKECYGEEILEATVDMGLTKSGSDSVKPNNAKEVWLSVQRKYCELSSEEFIMTTGPIFLYPLYADTKWLDRTQNKLEDFFKFTIAMDEVQSNKSFVHRIGKKLLTDTIRRRYDNYLKKFGLKLLLNRPKNAQLNGRFQKIEICAPSNREEMAPMNVWLIRLSAINEIEQSEQARISTGMQQDVDNLFQRARTEGLSVPSLLSILSNMCNEGARQADDIDDTSSGMREHPKTVVTQPCTPNSIPTTGSAAISSLGGSLSSSGSTFQSESIASSRTATSEDASTSGKERDDKNRKVNSAGIDSEKIAQQEKLRKSGGLLGKDVRIPSTRKGVITSIGLLLTSHDSSLQPVSIPQTSTNMNEMVAHVSLLYLKTSFSFISLVSLPSHHIHLSRVKRLQNLLKSL